MTSDKAPAAKRSRRLTDTIAEYLTTTIRDLAPGSKLPSEHQLAKQFGVSRSGSGKQFLPSHLSGYSKFVKVQGCSRDLLWLEIFRRPVWIIAISRIPPNCWRSGPAWMQQQRASPRSAARRKI